MSLSAITGNYDVKGSEFSIRETYSPQWAGFQTREHEFTHAHKPKDARAPHRRQALSAVGALYGRGADDRPDPADPGGDALSRQGCHGLRPQPPYVPRAPQDPGGGGRAGICHERGAVYDGHVPPLDIVLPVCTSFEREEFKVYPGGFATYIKPVIAPLYSARPDSTIIRSWPTFWTWTTRCCARAMKTVCAGCSQTVPSAWTTASGRTGRSGCLTPGLDALYPADTPPGNLNSIPAGIAPGDTPPPGFEPIPRCSITSGGPAGQGADYEPSAAPLNIPPASGLD